MLREKIINMDFFQIIWVLLGVCLLGFYNGLLLKDDKTPEESEENKKLENQWHLVGALVFIYLGITTYMMWGWEYIPLTLSSFWLIFGGIVHKIGLNKPFFFVGTSAKTDRLLRRFFPTNTEKKSAILKSVCFILSVLLIILKK